MTIPQVVVVIGAFISGFGFGLVCMFIIAERLRKKNQLAAIDRYLTRQVIEKELGSKL